MRKHACGLRDKSARTLQRLETKTTQFQAELGILRANYEASEKEKAELAAAAAAEKERLRLENEARERARLKLAEEQRLAAEVSVTPMHAEVAVGRQTQRLVGEVVGEVIVVAIVVLDIFVVGLTHLVAVVTTTAGRGRAAAEAACIRSGGGAQGGGLLCASDCRRGGADARRWFHL